MRQRSQIEPLISCIMPTFHRRQFVPKAIEYFLRQDYEPKELIIVNEGMDKFLWIKRVTPQSW